MPCFRKVQLLPSYRHRRKEALFMFKERVTGGGELIHYFRKLSRSPGRETLIRCLFIIECQLTGVIASRGT